MIEEISKKEDLFLKTMHDLAVTIFDFEHKITIGFEYDEDKSRMLFSVFKFLTKD